MKQEISDKAQQSRAKSDSFREIQMLRGLSILFVLLYHTGIKQFDQLFIGVDIFLFISGFVLAEKLENIYLPIGKWKDKSLVIEFLIRRFCRIVPALSVTITTFSLLFFLGTSIRDHTRIFKEGFLSILGLGNIGAFLFAGNYFTPSPNPFLHLWSLAIEAQFYLIIPIAGAICTQIWRIRFKEFIFIFGFFSFLLFLITDIASQRHFGVLNISSVDMVNFYGIQGRIWEFNAGILCKLLSRGKQETWYKYLELLLVLFIVFPGNFFSEPVRLEMYAVLCCFIVISNRFIPKIGKLGSLLVRIGDISFSLYLVHFPIRYLLTENNIDYKRNLSMFFFMYLALTFIFGLLLWNLVEEKFRKSSTKNLLFSSYFLLFTSVLSCSLIILSHSRHFYPWYPPVAQNSSTAPIGPCSLMQSGEPCLSSKSLANLKAGGGVMVFGDSHAAMFSREVLKRSRGMNVEFFSKSGCPFVKKMESLTSECIQHNLQAIKYLKEIHPKYLVVSNASSENYGIPIKAYLSAYKSELALASELVDQVVIIGPTPQFTVGRLFTRPHLLSKSFEEDKNLKNWVSQIGGIYFSTIENLCPSKACVLKVGNTWLYEDSDHLTNAGVKIAIQRWSKFT